MIGNFEIEKALLGKMIEYFGCDRKRINHAQEVLKRAKELLEREGGDNDVVVASAILHDIGLKECERKSPSLENRIMTDLELINK